MSETWPLKSQNHLWLFADYVRHYKLLLLLNGTWFPLNYSTRAIGAFEPNSLNLFLTTSSMIDHRLTSNRGDGGGETQS